MCDFFLYFYCLFLYDMRFEFFKSDELNFVEFNITGDNNNCQKLNEESYFLENEIFNLFVTCFENSNELYEYFEPTKYNARKIVVLRNELIKYLNDLESIENLQQFTSFIDHLFLGKAFVKSLEKTDAQWHNNWKTYHDGLIKVNREMIAIVDRCIDEARILWIIGY